MPHATHVSLVPLAVGLLAVIAFVSLVFRKSKPPPEKRSNGLSSLGWALLFLSSGRMPPPPPESQIEQDLKERDNSRQSADGDPDR